MENSEEFCVSASSSLKDSIFSIIHSIEPFVNSQHHTQPIDLQRESQSQGLHVGSTKNAKRSRIFCLGCWISSKMNKFKYYYFQVSWSHVECCFFRKKNPQKSAYIFHESILNYHFQASSLSLHFFHLRLSTSSRSKTLTKQLARCEIHKYTACDSHYFRTRFILLVAIPCRPPRAFSLSLLHPHQHLYSYIHRGGLSTF